VSQIEPSRKAMALKGAKEQPSLQFVDDCEAAEILGVAPQTLRNWRVSGRGPEFYRFEGVVRYEMNGLYDYARSRRRRSTSEAA
jgi:hypothetical protein